MVAVSHMLFPLPEPQQAVGVGGVGGEGGGAGVGGQVPKLQPLLGPPVQPASGLHEFAQNGTFE